MPNNVAVEFTIGQRQAVETEFTINTSPTKVSQLENDLDFQTKDEVDTALEGKQDVLTAGEGISIENNVISAAATSAEWGLITGDIDDQTDLKNALDAKQDVISDLSTIRSGASAGATAVQSVTTGTTNGTIKVDGTDVSVYGLGSAAYTSSTDYDAAGSASTAETSAKNYADSLASNYATAAQGALADTAVQPSDLPIVNNATLTIQKNGVDVQTFTANASTNATANITVPTDTGDLTNGAGFITSSALSGYATQTWVGQQGYITGITSGDVTTALGYTPYSDANPNGYTSNVGTVTSVNNTSPDGNGNVTLSIPAAQVNSDWNAVSGVAEILNKPTIPTVNDSTITLQQNGTTVDSFTLNQASNKTINIETPDDYYTRDEVDSLVPQDVKTPIVYYQPTTSYCYDESDNRFYGSRVSEKLYLAQPKTSGTTQVIDMSSTFSLDFSFKYLGAPSSTFTLAEIIVSSASGKGVLLQVNSSGMYYRNNITSSTVTGTRSLVVGNIYDIRVEHNGTKMIISWKLSTDANYTEINATTCNVSGTYYNYASIGSDGDSIYLPLSSVVLDNNGTTLYDYVAGKIALDYDETLTLDSNQLSVVVDQTYDGTSANPQSGIAVASAIPTVNNATISFTQGGVSKGSITLNQATDQTIALDAGGGGSYTAGTGIDITSNTISVTAPTLTNTATGSDALTILGTSATTTGTVNIGYGSSGVLQSVSIGQNAKATGVYGVAIGRGTKANSNAIAIGYTAEATASYAIQLGYGTNSEANSFYVATSSSNNWKMLGSDGLIPAARLPIATSVSSSSTNGESVGAKLFYDTCGDIETLINAL